MNKQLIPALTAGLLASCLFLVVFGIGLGFLFMFLPTLPLFFIGLSRHHSNLLLTLGVSFAAITLIASLQASILFLVFLGLPALAISRQGLLHNNTQEWYPIGLIINNLAVYATIVIALLTLYYTSEPGGLPGLLADNIKQAFAGLEQEYGDVINMIANQWSFLVFPITIWMWGLALYAHGWAMNRWLAQKQMNIRPDFMVEPFTTPTWMLGLLTISALASLIGSPSMAFLGKASFIILLLPYFFAGAAVMHRASAKWPSGRFFLFFIYFIIFSQFWPALILAGVGLWNQLKDLSGAKN